MFIFLTFFVKNYKKKEYDKNIGRIFFFKNKIFFIKILNYYKSKFFKKKIIYHQNLEKIIFLKIDIFQKKNNVFFFKNTKIVQSFFSKKIKTFQKNHFLKIKN